MVRAITAEAASLLGRSEPLPRSDDLARTTTSLRERLSALVPGVETLARLLPEGDTLRVGAMLGTGEARARLAAGPGDGLKSATAYADGLAQILGELCDRYEWLAATMPGAHRLLLDHTQGCGACDGGDCPEGAALRRAWRTARDTKGGGACPMP